MGEASAPIVAASIAGTIALTAALIAAVVSMRNESKRRAQERESARLASIRQSAAEVFKEMFVLQHEVEWLTWHARNESDALTEEMRLQYNSAIHVSIPKLLGSLAVLASLDLNTYRNLLPIARNLFALDAETAKIATKLTDPQSREEALEGLREQFKVAHALWDELPDQMASVMRGEEPAAPKHAGQQGSREP